jgi:uncharacterized protein YndB with AHSA1/START domain
MTISPIIHTVQVKAPVSRAFDLFARRMGDWWPRGKTIGKEPHAEIVIEPNAGGRWFERDVDGNETQWGQVLAWDPPSRVLLGWQINAQWAFDPNLLTELELTFAPTAGGGTLVRLEHRNLERFGADAERFSDQIRGGWPGMIAAFAGLADAEGVRAQ